MGKNMSHLIRRYSNRKMFSHDKHSFVDLSDIYNLYKSGENLKILERKMDTETNQIIIEDITTDIIVQAIVHTEKENPKFRKMLFNYAKK